MNEEHLPFGDDFLSLIEFMQGQDPVLQWIVGALIIALTVGMIVFTVYMMKLVITTIIKMIKGAVKVGKAVDIITMGQSLHESPQGQMWQSPVTNPYTNKCPESAGANKPKPTTVCKSAAQTVEIKTDYFCQIVETGLRT